MTSMRVGGLFRAAARAAAALALTAVIAAGAGAQQGQGGPPPGGPGGGRGMGGGGRQVQMLLEGIALTDAQQKQVDSIRTAFQQRMAATRPSSAGASAGSADAPQRPDSATMAARRKLMEDQQGAIRAVLTVEQQKTWDANVEQMRQRMRDRGGPGGGGTGGGTTPPPAAAAASSGQR